MQDGNDVEALVTANMFTSTYLTVDTAGSNNEIDLDGSRLRGLSSDSGTIVFDIRYKATHETSEETLVVNQTFSKSKAGQNSRSIKLISIYRIGFRLFMV